MRTTILLLKATAIVPAMHTVLMPSAKPTDTINPWQCVTENLTQYFDMPKPTGSLLTAILSYGEELLKTCTATGLARQSCPFPEQSRWCDFTTAAPSDVIPAYLSYGSVASSWWSVHSSAAVVLAELCPIGWYNAMMRTVWGQTWLNDTIIFGECYAQARSTTESSMTGPTATTGLGVPKAGPEATPTNVPNGVLRRTEGAEAWMVAGTGLVAAAVNSVW